MSPPGKNSGETTNESVVNASRPAEVVSDAPSSSGSSNGLRNASRPAYTNMPASRGRATKLVMCMAPVYPIGWRSMPGRS